MTDFEAVYGPYRAIICEWINSNDTNRCRQPTERGKSYCEHHYNEAYRSVSSDSADTESALAIAEAETIETPKDEEFDS